LTTGTYFEMPRGPVGHKIRTFTRILSLFRTTLDYWNSSAYKFGKFIHKIAMLYYYYRSLAQHTTSFKLFRRRRRRGNLWSTQQARRRVKFTTNRSNV